MTRPRFHLDIETDDVEAETAALARPRRCVQVTQWLECRVLRAPKWPPAVRVIPVHSDPGAAFKAQATTWP